MLVTQRLYFKTKYETMLARSKSPTATSTATAAPGSKPANNRKGNPAAAATTLKVSAKAAAPYNNTVAAVGPGDLAAGVSNETPPSRLLVESAESASDQLRRVLAPDAPNDKDQNNAPPAKRFKISTAKVAKAVCTAN